MRMLFAALLCLISSPAFAQRVDNPTAEFAGLDKITARIIKFDVKINETVQFGALQVTPRVCYSSAANDDPLTTGFVEVEELTLENKLHRLFSGWMFADSPGLNAVEHPIYDIWLVSCKGGKPPKISDDAAAAAPQDQLKTKAKPKKKAPEPAPDDDSLFEPPPQAPRQLQPGVPFDPDQLPPER